MVEPAGAEPAAWAVPGTPAEDPGVLAAVVAPVVPSDGPPRRDEPPAVPVPLRAMSTSDRLDGSFRILKLAPGTVLSLAAAVVLPVQALAAALAADAGGREGWEVVLGPGPLTLLADDAPSPGPAIVLLAVQSLGLSFVAAGIATLLSAWYLGRTATTTEVLAASARRLPSLAAAWLLVHLAELAFGLFLVLPAILPMLWFAVVAPVIAVEGAGPFAALKRSFRLTRRSLDRVGGTVLAAAAVDVLLRVLLGLVVVAGGADELPAGEVLAGVVGIAIQLLTVPFVAGVAALLYVDLRVRGEGIDIELAVVERFPGG